METGSEDGSSQDLPPLGESTDQVGTGRRGYPGCHGGARWMTEWESQRAPQMGPVQTGLGQVFYQCYLIVIMPDFQYCHLPLRGTSIALEVIDCGYEAGLSIMSITTTRD